MITLKNLPSSYIPYENLVICSNSMIGGGHIVAIGNVLPLVIGKGEKPKIWLTAITNSDIKKFIPVIEASVSKHSSVKVLEENSSIIVTIQNKKVLVVQPESINKAIISQLDLRPFGLNLFGDEASLTVGGSKFTNNSMSGG